MWRPHNQRAFAWIVCLVSGLLYGFHMAVAAMPSMLVASLMTTFKLDAAHVGLLDASYFYAYAIAQLFIGGVIDRFGPRRVLSLGALVCAAGTIGFAFSTTIELASIARVVSGLGSACALGASLKLGAWWLPPRRLGIFAGIVAATGAFGAISNLALVPSLVETVGWRRTSMAVGAGGFVIAALLWAAVRDAPEGHDAPTSAAFRQRHPLWTNLWALARRGGFWLNALAGACFFLPVSLLANFWGVKFLEQGHGFSERHAAEAVALIFVGNALGGPFIGWISDRLGRRRSPMLISMSITFVVVLALVFFQGPTSTLYAMLFIVGVMMGAEALLFVIAREVSPPGTVATGVAVTNAIIALGGAIFVPVVGAVLDATWAGTMSEGTRVYVLASFQRGFLVMPAALLVAFVLMCFVPKTNARPTQG